MKQYKSVFKEGKQDLKVLKNKIYKLYVSNAYIPDSLLDEVYLNDDVYTDNVRNREYIQFRDDKNRQLRLVFNTQVVPHELQSIQKFERDLNSYIGNEGSWTDI